MENPTDIEGGPVWRESAFTFDLGCRMVGEPIESLGRLIALWAGREGSVSGETIRRWRRGPDEPPFWAFRGLWRCLRHRGFEAAALRAALGYEFAE